MTTSSVTPASTTPLQSSPQTAATNASTGGTCTGPLMVASDGRSAAIAACRGASAIAAMLLGNLFWAIPVLSMTTVAALMIYFRLLELLGPNQKPNLNALTLKLRDLHNLALTVKYSLTGRYGEQLAASQAVGTTSFFVSSDVTTDERQALPLATEDLATRLVSQISEGW